MSPPAEGSYAPPASGAGPPFRILQVQTMIAGEPVMVDIEGVMMIDADGRIVFKPGDSTELLTKIIAELRAIKMQLAALTGMPTDIGPAGESLGG